MAREEEGRGGEVVCPDATWIGSGATTWLAGAMMKQGGSYEHGYRVVQRTGDSDWLEQRCRLLFAWRLVLGRR